MTKRRTVRFGLNRKNLLREWSLDPYQSHSGRVEAFWRTLILDKVRIRRQPEQCARPDVGDMFETLLNNATAGPPGIGHEQSVRDSFSFEDWLNKWEAKHEMGRRLRWYVEEPGQH